MIRPSTGLPPNLSLMMTTAAEHWLASPSRPHPHPDVLQHWDKLVDEWIANSVHPGNSSVKLEYEVSSASQGAVVACGETVVVFVDSAGSKALPADARAWIEAVGTGRHER